MALKFGDLSELEPQVFELEVRGRPITADSPISPAMLWERYRNLSGLLRADVAGTEEDVGAAVPAPDSLDMGA